MRRIDSFLQDSQSYWRAFGQCVRIGCNYQWKLFFNAHLHMAEFNKWYTHIYICMCVCFMQTSLCGFGHREMQKSMKKFFTRQIFTYFLLNINKTFELLPGSIDKKISIGVCVVCDLQKLRRKIYSKSRLPVFVYPSYFWPTSTCWFTYANLHTTYIHVCV